MNDSLAAYLLGLLMGFLAGCVFLAVSLQESGADVVWPRHGSGMMPLEYECDAMTCCDSVTTYLKMRDAEKP